MLEELRTSPAATAARRSAHALHDEIVNFPAERLFPALQEAVKALS